MALLSRWDPFAELEQLQRQFFGDTFARSNMVQPMTDVYTKDDKELVVEAHLPGFNKDDIDVNVHEGVLEIRAEKHDTEEDKGKKKYVLRESASSFYRRVRLPNVANESQVKAEYTDGTLKVSVPFKELPQPNRIAITEGKKSAKK